MSKNLKKKYKCTKQKTIVTTNPETSTSRIRHDPETRLPEPCPLLAKDSQWADIVQSNTLVPDRPIINIFEEEEVLQLVECEEDGLHMKPIAVMFPDLLEKDPQTLQGILNKAMSTTEVTKHLVDLGQKANFTFMKKADRLIPPEKEWLESVTETSNSFASLISSLPSDYTLDSSSDDDSDFEYDLKFSAAHSKCRSIWLENHVISGKTAVNLISTKNLHQNFFKYILRRQRNLFLLFII